ncbi:MAG: hypothetical protein ABFS30_05320 [Pseudomonadota bacterium]
MDNPNAKNKTTHAPLWSELPVLPSMFITPDPQKKHLLDTGQFKNAKLRGLGGQAREEPQRILAELLKNT